VVAATASRSPSGPRRPILPWVRCSTMIALVFDEYEARAAPTWMFVIQRVCWRCPAA